MTKKDKIDVSGGESSLGHNPFENLQMDNLPEAPAKTEMPTPSPSDSKSKKGRVVLRRETAHRGGKCVIVVYDFAPFIGMQEIEELGRRLRNACGCGGTVRERVIELQGDQPAKIRSFLEKEGFRVAGVT